MNTAVNNPSKQSRLVIVLILCQLAAALLYFSWSQTQDTRFDKNGDKRFQYSEQASDSLWKQVDYKVFRTLNGSLKNSPSAQTFWAICNNRAFDLVQAILLGLILWFSVFWKKTPEENLARIKVGFCLAATTIICIQTLHYTLFNFQRLSPSLKLKSEVLRLSQLDHVTWSLKDASLNSFPGDHATVLFIVAIYITYFAGKRWGIMALAVAFLCALPRMVGGAHWATDILVGGTFIALISTSWTLCSRNWKIGPELFHKLSLFSMAIAGKIIPSLKPPGASKQASSATKQDATPHSISEKEAPVRKKRDLKENVYLFFTGVCMGAADIVPGVSGGTMAFIMGIYEELLDAIKSFNLRLIQLALKFKIKDCFQHVPWQFLLVLGSGLLITLKLLANVVHGVLGDPTGKVFLYAFFFGLVVASIVTLSRHLKWSLSAIISFIIGTALAWVIVGLVPAEMPHTAPYLFFSGMIAIMAMILPGISGSFILLLLGQYAFVVGALKDLDLKVFVIFAAGSAVGLLGFSRVLSWLLKHYHALTIAGLIGFMMGSLRKIWPFKDIENTTFIEDRHGDLIPVVEPNCLPDFSSSQWWIALGLVILGIVLILVLEMVNQRMSARRDAR